MTNRMSVKCIDDSQLFMLQNAYKYFVFYSTCYSSLNCFLYKFFAEKYEDKYLFRLTKSKNSVSNISQGSPQNG